VWPDGADPSSDARFRHPAPGLSVDPADIPLEVLADLAHECVSRQSGQDAALVAMRDACGMRTLREASRDRFLEALERARVSFEG
jgi:hypothetical protein